MEGRKRVEERRRDTLRLIEQEHRAAAGAAAGGRGGPGESGDPLDTINTDDEADDAEYEAWKLRELRRLKRDKVSLRQQYAQGQGSINARLHLFTYLFKEADIIIITVLRPSYSLWSWTVIQHTSQFSVQLSVWPATSYL